MQGVGIALCLQAATRISHRAQGIAALASRWHALMTCGSSSEGSVPRPPSGVGNLDPPFVLSSLHIDYSESDLESSDYVPLPTSAQLASYMSTYHKRQAFGMKSNFLKFHPMLLCLVSLQVFSSATFGWLNIHNFLSINLKILSDLGSNPKSLQLLCRPVVRSQCTDFVAFQFLDRAVAYLQTNPGGITIFGVTVDKALINTIFFIELTLVTFVLGKTIVVSSS